MLGAGKVSGFTLNLTACSANAYAFGALQLLLVSFALRPVPLCCVASRLNGIGLTLARQSRPRSSLRVVTFEVFAGALRPEVLGHRAAFGFEGARLAPCAAMDYCRRCAMCQVTLCGPLCEERSDEKSDCPRLLGHLSAGRRTFRSGNRLSRHEPIARRSRYVSVGDSCYQGSAATQCDGRRSIALTSGR